jgi:ornithine cyclodeaminase/alanine dehydrogenase-like protein (mu-crystallin family)
VTGWSLGNAVHELSTLLLGRVPERTDEKEITLFKLQGTGIMDVAIGLAAYEKLKNGTLAQNL